MDSMDDIYLSGVPIRKLMECYGLRRNELMAYLPIMDIGKRNIAVHYLGYYLKWTPQEAYYYAVENTGFEANAERSEGTYSKYNSLDDKIDGFHYYTTYIKFGLGRASYDAAQEIRNKHITRDEGIALVKRFDGEFPIKYYYDILSYIDLSHNKFVESIEKFRPKHLWKEENGEWKLKNQVQ